MADEDLPIDDDPRPEDVALLNDLLYQFNSAVSGVADGRWLAIFVRDAQNGMEAGLHGWTWGRTCFVQTLWIREDRRRQGLGSRLMAAAEREAVERGCREIQLDTHSYQAPGFYRRLGYEVIGELPGWPNATTRIFFRKVLAQKEDTT
jgi:ribosomal protein S18 acetylase RimI-like enzyme